MYKKELVVEKQKQGMETAVSVWNEMLQTEPESNRKKWLGWGRLTGSLYESPMAWPAPALCVKFLFLQFLFLHIFAQCHSLIAHLVKNLPAMQEKPVQLLGQEDLLEKFPLFLCFPCGSASRESTYNVGGLGLIPGLGRSPGEGKCYPLQYSCLENSMDSIVHGSQRVGRHWATFTISSKMPLLITQPSVQFSHSVLL